jgi:hypothetical protein
MALDHDVLFTDKWRKNMAQPEKRSVLLTPKFQVAFPQIVEMKVFAPGQKGRFSCVALFNPSEFNDKDKGKFKALVEACNKVSLETFKKPMKELDRSVYKTPFHKGEEKDQYAGFGAGIIFFTMSAYMRRPGVVGIDGTPCDPADLYPGCYARASVNPFANQQWKSISIGMNHLQKLGEGERLDGATSAEDDFGSDPAEYDASDTGAEASDENDFGA